MLASLLRPIRGQLAVACCASALSGVASMVLVAQLNRALTAEASELGRVGASFIGASVIGLSCRWLSEERFARLGQDTLARLRVAASATIARLPLRQFEARGAASFNAILTEDAGAVAHACSILPGALINTFLVLGSLAYMASLSLSVFGVVVALLLVGTAAYVAVEGRALGLLRRARNAEDQVFAGFGGLLEGAKELRLHAPRRRAFLRDGLDAAIERARALRSRGLSVSIAASSVGAFLFFAVIGGVVFGLSPRWAIERSVVSGYALVFLYLMFPLESLLGCIPMLERGRVALERIEALTGPIEVPAMTATTQAPRGARLPAGLAARSGVAAAPGGAFTSLRLDGVVHAYQREAGGGEFVLGPIELELQPGEVTFLIGGNGSGKTTLAKLLVGLYAPERGRIWLNGAEVTDEARAAHRACCSAVFSDYHLFERLWGLEGAEHVAADVKTWLDELELSPRVGFDGERFSSTALSMGQRKRLALLVAALERRPVLLFDEWAADQDPVHKDVFYRRWLPALAAQGKAIVVVTHDDRYFELGDRCLKLDSGRLTELPRAGAPPARGAERRAVPAAKYISSLVPGE
ncbi:MAG TPA: cyclic peptide export ABC transporter [Polyangiaceae bacterium]|nr:cyclic peptide export ABC transporter [Polyangiaceae bacterium]